MRSRGSRFLTGPGAIAAGAAALAYAAYRNDIKAARQRIETGKQVIDSVHGPIEFAEAGNGPAVLLVHGAGGGFDQGLTLGRAFLGENYRVIAPSRFGYLGTPLPADASPEAQADAHLRLLDTLKLDNVAVIGVSAGSPSAMQLCLNHPERCSALVLLVPLAYAPPRETATAHSRHVNTVLNAIASNDFLFWSAMKLARPALLKTILGTPVEDYRNATIEERRGVDQVLREILPISKRIAGISNDAIVSNTLTRYPLEEMLVPTLAISAANCLYETYDRALYTAEEIPHATFIGFATGGHLLVGHEEEVRSQVRGFLNACLEAKTAAAMVS